MIRCFSIKFARTATTVVAIARAERRPIPLLNRVLHTRRLSR